MWIIGSVLTLALLAAAAQTVWRIPPQHMPWGALDLAAPKGIFTFQKLSAVQDDFPACVTALETAAVTVTAINDRRAGQCDLSTQVTLGKSAYPYSARVSGRCGLVAALVWWERHVVMPAAQAYLGVQVTRIEQAGVFACRPVRGSSARMSQHASANAIDITGFRLADGRHISVLRDWGKDTPEGAFLRAVRDGACGPFRGVLGPDYNALHRDHFHFDRGPYRICR